MFITDEGQYSNAHVNYGWAIYTPVDSSGYRMATDESTLIAAGPDGPPYVGYVDEIKEYGVVTGAKNSVHVDYQDKKTVKSQEIRANDGLANTYPKYFGDKGPKRHVTVSTLAQLAQKYANSYPNNVITRASK